MHRRSFLKGLAAIPFAPAALRRHAEHLVQQDEEREIEALRTRPADKVLGVAMGEPSALTIAVPPNRTIKITGWAILVGEPGKPAMLKIVESPMKNPTVLAATAVMPGSAEHVEVGVVLRPTEGSHTYHLVATDAEMVNTWGTTPVLLVEDQT